MSESQTISAPVQDPAPKARPVIGKWLLVAGLAFLNVVLGIGVYQRLFEKSALAQGGIGNARPDISAVAGNAGGQTAVYMLDVNSGALAVLRLDISNHRMVRVAVVNVGADLKRIAGGGGPGGR